MIYFELSSGRERSDRRSPIRRRSMVPMRRYMVFHFATGYDVSLFCTHCLLSIPPTLPLVSITPTYLFDRTMITVIVAYIGAVVSCGLIFMGLGMIDAGIRTITGIGLISILLIAIYFLVCASC